jgi:Flp pilus assembly pilin Flp
MKYMMEFWKDEEGIGVVEIILILVVLIALVLIFKNKITEVVNNAFESFENDSDSILGSDD